MRSRSGFVLRANVLARGRAQAVDLFQSERAELSRRHIERERPILHALDFLHVVTDLLKHAPDLPIAAFDQRDFVPGIGRILDDADPGRRGAHTLALVGCDGEAARSRSMA